MESKLYRWAQLLIPILTAVWFALSVFGILPQIGRKQWIVIDVLLGFSIVLGIVMLFYPTRPREPRISVFTLAFPEWMPEHAGYLLGRLLEIQFALFQFAKDPSGKLMGEVEEKIFIEGAKFLRSLDGPTSEDKFFLPLQQLYDQREESASEIASILERCGGEYLHMPYCSRKGKEVMAATAFVCELGIDYLDTIGAIYSPTGAPK